MTKEFDISLDEYEIANLRAALNTLRRLGLDTGDWMGQILMKLPNTTYKPNKNDQEQLRELAVRVGWKCLSL